MARSRKEARDQLREALAAQGTPLPAMAAEMGRRLGLRPRTAWRHARGWTQWQLAMEYQLANPGSRIATSRISEYETWPHGGIEPPVDHLAGLALTYGHGCTLADLVDDVDHAHHSPTTEFILSSVPASQRPHSQRRRPDPGVPHIVIDGSDSAALLPAGRYFPGARTDVVAVPGEGTDRIMARIGPHSGVQPAGRNLVVAVVDHADGHQLFGMDVRRARRWIVDPKTESRVPVPQAYVLDDVALAVLWATKNFDAALLDDDAEIDHALASLRRYEAMPASTVASSTVPGISAVTQMWLGSAFCATHIQRHAPTLTSAPQFWTREQRGEEASAWLLFSHKLAYLRIMAPGTSDETQRVFCIPHTAVEASSRPERILMFLAAALMESAGIAIAVTSEPAYEAVPGFVTDRFSRSILATWIGTESLWHVDVPDQRPQLREFTDALDDAASQSLTSGRSPGRRLQALADYLALDWAWLTARCAELGEYGAGGLVQPRSRHLSIDGIDQACRFVGTFAPVTR